MHLRVLMEVKLDLGHCSHRSATNGPPEICVRRPTGYFHRLVNDAGAARLCDAAKVEGLFEHHQWFLSDNRARCNWMLHNLGNKRKLRFPFLHPLWGANYLLRNNF